MNTGKILVLAALLWCQWCTAGRSETLYLAVAASMTDALKEVITVYRQEHPKTTILPNFASSGALAKQIDQGAPADLYISANPKWMRFLAERKMIADSTERIFAFNTLVFVGGPATTIASIEELAELEKIGIGAPQSVPAGQYAKQAMEHAGIYRHLQQARKLVMAKDVRQALLYADRGEVDGAFVYRTDALLARKATIRFTVPASHYSRVSYPLALTVSGAEKPEAATLYRFMVSEKAMNILEKYGFEPAR